MKKKMENFKSHFKITDNKDVIACGIPALDGDNHGRDLGNDIAAFWGKGKTFILVNMRTGKLREFVNADGQLLVEDKDIDYDSIHRHHNHYHCCVDCKRVEFGFNRYNDFKNGLCALVGQPIPMVVTLRMRMDSVWKTMTRRKFIASSIQTLKLSFRFNRWMM